MCMEIESLCYVSPPLFIMASREELEAVMSSTGDSEKKISLLKKAIVVVTKQKQELEGKYLTVCGELERTQDELAGLKDKNIQLTQRLVAVEEAEEARKKSFGQGMFKGWSSLVTGDAAAGARKGQGEAAPSGVSQEGVQQLIAENEGLHKKLFQVESELQELRKTYTAKESKRAMELKKAEREVTELRTLLESATQACDLLNTEVVTQRGFNFFCRSFFTLGLDTSPAAPLSAGSSPPSPSATASGGAAGGRLTVKLRCPPHDVEPPLHAAQRHIATTTKQFSLLLLAVTNAGNALLESLPRGRNQTVGDIANHSRLLKGFLQSHASAKEAILSAATQLQSATAAETPEASPSADDSALAVHSLIDTLLSTLLRWLHMVSVHVPLLVECLVVLLMPRGVKNPRLPSSPASSAPVDRETLTREAVKSFSTIVLSLEGSIDALTVLLKSASEAFAALSPQSPMQCPAAWLATLLSFLAEGALSGPLLSDSIAQANEFLRSAAANCDSSVLRDSLTFIAAELAKLQPTTTTTAPPQCPASHHTALPVRNNSIGGGGGGARSYAETGDTADLCTVLNALSAADNAAVLYHSHTEQLLLELAMQKDVARALEQEIERLQLELSDKCEEAERARVVMQNQITLLSEQLTASSLSR